MPELPEVETIKRCLEPDILGKVIADIEILSQKNFIGKKQDVIGKKIISINRYGKVLVFKLAPTTTSTFTSSSPARCFLPKT
jgi:Formamidopyrimidine-DNA glycosylase